MKRKGFTLIELLAVIVVLAIIALIATPIVMNVIKNASKGAAERSAERYLDAVETTIIADRLEHDLIADGNYFISDDGKLTRKFYVKTSNGSWDYTEKEVSYDVEVSGDYPLAGIISISNGQIQLSDTILAFEDYTISFDDNGKASLIEYVVPEESCFEYNSKEQVNLKYKVTNKQACIEENSSIMSSYGMDVEQICSGNYKDVNNLQGFCYAGPGCSSHLEFYYDKTSIEGLSKYTCNYKNIKLPDNIVEIADSAFYDKGLTNVIIPDSVTTIGENAFAGNRLITVTIGKNVKEIGSYAFWKDNWEITGNFHLVAVYNKTGKIFDWYDIIGPNCSATTEACTDHIIIDK